MIIKIYKNEENRTCLVLLAKRATKKKKKKEEKAVCVFVAVFIYSYIVICCSLANAEHLLELGASLLHAVVEVAADGLVGPRLVVERGLALLLGIAVQVEHGLEVLGLRDEPLVDERLRIVAERGEELALYAQLIELRHVLVDLGVELGHLGQRLRLTRRQEALHLIAQHVVDLHLHLVDGRALGLVRLDVDQMVDDNRIGRHAVHVQLARYVREADAFALEYLLQVLVQVDQLLLLGVLEPMRLDVGPERLDDDGPRGRVYAEQLGEARVELELRRLVVEQHEYGAAQRLVAVSLDLEAVRFGRLRRAMPLDQMVVRPVQLLVQLDHQALEERAELARLAGARRVALVLK